MNFGKNLQILRKMTGMTQEELAERINVSRQTISKWELEAILPEVEKLVLLLRAVSLLHRPDAKGKYGL